MAQNLIACGDVFDYTVPSSTTIASGDPVLVGKKLGIALVSGTEDDIIPVQMEGVFSVTKKTHASTQALAQGDAVYWDNSAKKVTNTSNGGAYPLVGFAFAD